MNLTNNDVEWVVNDMGELGVKIKDQFFFCYKGGSIMYKEGVHDDGTPIMWRPVGKVEFGETVWPMKWIRAGQREARYNVDLNYIEGISWGKPEDCAWRDLPTTKMKE